MRLLVALLAFGVALLAAPVPASAHAGGLTATDGRSSVVSVSPAVPGLRVFTIENGARIRLVNGTGKIVAPVPGGGPAVPEAVAPGREATWIDTRVTPDGRSLAPGQVETWSLEVLVAASPAVRVTVAGVTAGEEPPLPLLWWAASVLVAATVIVLSRRLARGDLLLCVAGLVAAGASIAHVAGSALAVESAPLAGTFLSAAGINLLAWPLIVGGAVSAFRGRAAGILAVCGGAALTAVFVLPDVTSFHRAVLPFAGPGVVERVLVVLALGLGAGVAVAGAGVLRTLARQPSALLLIGILLLGGCARTSPVEAAPVSCGSAAPGAVPINVALSEGRAEPEPHRVSVPIDSSVLLGVSADVASEVHVHGYDLVYPVQVGQPACVLFVADRAGVFDVEAHPSTMLLQIEVR